MPRYKHPADVAAEAHPIAAALRRTPPISIGLEAHVWFTVAAQLQLALRHPRNTGPTAEIARRLVSAIRAEMPPVVQEAIDQGDDPRCDVEVVRENGA